MRKIRIRVNKTKVNDLKLRKIRIRVNKTKVNNLRLKASGINLSGKLATVILVTWLVVAGFAFSVNHFGTNAYFSDTETANDCSFTAEVPGFSWSYPDCPPDIPILIAPENNTEGMHLNPILTVHVTDPNDDTMDVYFYSAADNILIDTVTNVENNTEVSVTWHVLDYGVTYEWYVIAEDYEGPVQSDTWKFTTNYPPEMPLILSPLNNSLNVDLSPTLKVQVFDTDNYTLNVSFYDASTHDLIGKDVNITNGENASIIWDDLSYSSTYLWYAIVYDDMTKTRSETWSFTTMSNPSGGGGGSSGDDTAEKSLPVADAGGLYSCNVSETITFNGSKSNDSDGNIVNYTWNFGDGDEEYGISPVHSYSEAGVYTILLTVVDNDNLTDTNTTVVTVTDILEITNVLVTPEIQNIGEYINITCTITNTTGLADITLNLTSSNGTCTTSSIYQNSIENTSSYYYNQTYDSLGPYSFFITATDIKDNVAISETSQFFIDDLISPEISNVTITPDVLEINAWINITTNVTDNIGVKDVLINVTYPNNTTTNTSMIQENGTNNYYYNSTYLDYGEYTFFIFALDIHNNSVKSESFTFSIDDLNPPEIVDYTSPVGYKNDTFTFNATVTDNDIVAEVSVEYWYETGNHTNMPMNYTDDTLWEKNITTPADQSVLYYVIYARDAFNNLSHTEIKSIALTEKS